MDDTFCPPDQVECPDSNTVPRELCSDRRGTCPKWVKLIAGKDQETGELINRWACSHSWEPILLVELNGAIGALDATVGAMRAELTTSNEKLEQLALEQLKTLNNTGAILQRMLEEMTRHNDGLLRLGQGWTPRGVPHG